jgi:hypothetical protein
MIEDLNEKEMSETVGAFIMSVIWSVGGVLLESSRNLFEEKFREILLEYAG